MPALDALYAVKSLPSPFSPVGLPVRMIEPPLPVASIDLHRVLDGEERAGEVDVDRALPHVEVEVGGRGILSEQLHAGVRDDDIRRPPARRRVR